jgi:type I restriction enzyme S subunit
MNAMQQLLTEHMAIWTAADTEKKSGRGRASGNAGSVYGIKKLRELILELAVRGKLVPQDANDEPASELLKRIQVEKAKLVAEGKIKKEKLLAPITEDEKPFEIPEGWKWVRLNEIAEANTGYAFKSNEYTNEGTFVLRVTNINPDSSINPDDVKFISTESANNEYKNFQLAEGDVLLVMVGGSLGKIGVVDKDCLPAVLNQNMWKLTNFGQLEKKYFIDGLRFINRSQIVITESTHGHLAQGEYLSKLFPLPPLAQQHRIVAKVDELMALCDQLEMQHSNAAEAHEKLVNHLLGTLTQSQNADDFSANWQRIATNFDTLFTTEASIDSFKQTLLQLAVMGKLVPQDANDEPASELLKRMQTEKAKLVVEGKIKKDKPLAPIGDDDKPFELPHGWEWSKVLDCSVFVTDGEHATPKRTSDGLVPLVTAKNVRDGYMDYDDTDFVDILVAEKCWNRCKPEQDDLLMVSVGATLGRLTILHESKDMVIVRSVTLIRPCLLNPLYLSLAIKSPLVQQAIWGSVRQMAQPGLYLAQSSNLVIPLPPLSEQQRIVAKVDELMTLCDQLKTRITAVKQLQQKMADVMVSEATN